MVCRYLMWWKGGGLQMHNWLPSDLSLYSFSSSLSLLQPRLLWDARSTVPTGFRKQPAAFLPDSSLKHSFGVWSWGRWGCLAICINRSENHICPRPMETRESSWHFAVGNRTDARGHCLGRSTVASITSFESSRTGVSLSISPVSTQTHPRTKPMACSHNTGKVETSGS